MYKQYRWGRSNNFITTTKWNVDRLLFRGMTIVSRWPFAEIWLPENSMIPLDSSSIQIQLGTYICARHTIHSHRSACAHTARSLEWLPADIDACQPFKSHDLITILFASHRQGSSVYAFSRSLACSRSRSLLFKTRQRQRQQQQQRRGITHVKAREEKKRIHEAKASNSNANRELSVLRGISDVIQRCANIIRIRHQRFEYENFWYWIYYYIVINCVSNGGGGFCAFAWTKTYFHPCIIMIHDCLFDPFSQHVRGIFDSGRHFAHFDLHSWNEFESYVINLIKLVLFHVVSVCVCALNTGVMP